MQLVLHWLFSGPCRASAATLAEEAAGMGLLPRRHDVQGARHGCGRGLRQIQSSAAAVQAVRQVRPRLHASLMSSAAGSSPRHGAPTITTEPHTTSAPHHHPPPPRASGARHVQTYAQLVAERPQLPGAALQQLLEQVVAAKRQSGVPGAAVRPDGQCFRRKTDACLAAAATQMHL
jgi:hypothetical protein